MLIVACSNPSVCKVALGPVWKVLGRVLDQPLDIFNCLLLLIINDENIRVSGFQLTIGSLALCLFSWTDLILIFLQIIVIPEAELCCLELVCCLFACECIL
jgi:hypothetical protein